jgi:hypothetical protein
MMSSASSGSSFQTERHVSGGTPHRSTALELHDLVVELELQLAGGDEVDLLLLPVSVAVRPLPPVRCGMRRYVKATCSASSAPVIIRISPG